MAAEDLPERDDDAQHLDDLRAERLAKLERLRAAGIDPYPVGIEVNDRLADVAQRFADKLEAGEGSGEHVDVAGRIVARRGFGKLAFLVLREGDVDLQALCTKGGLGDAGMALLDDLDVGDWVAVSGEVIRSKKGELSVQADTLTLIGKSLRPR